MDRHPDFVQKSQAPLQSVGKLVGGGGQCHNGGTDDKVDQPQGHKPGQPQPLPGNLQKSQGKYHPPRCQKQIEADTD